MGKTILFVCLVLSSVQLFANKKFLPPPTVQATNLVLTPDGASMNMSWTNGNGAQRIVIMRQGSAVTGTPVNGVDYGFSQSFGTGPVLNAGEYIVYVGSSSSSVVVNLTPGSTYFVTVFEFNGTGAATDYLLANAPVASGTTYSSAPTVQASNVQFSNIGTNSMTITWTSGNGTGALVVMSANVAVNAVPANLTFYFSNARFGSGTQVSLGNFAVFQTTPTIPNTVTVTNLQPGIVYHVAVFELNGGFTPLYNTVNPARGSQVISGRPSVAPSNVTFNTIEGNSLRINWTNGNGVRRIVVAGEASAVTASPVDGIDYAADADFTLAPELAPGQKVVFDGNTNFANVSGLQPSTTYHFRIYEYFGTGVNIQYLTTSFGSGSQSTLLPPTTQSSNIIFSDIRSDRVDMAWTRGNGTQRVMLMKAGAPVDADPVNLQVYLPDQTFGMGSEIGNGNFVVQRGNDLNYRVFGLLPGITYHVAIYEFNGITGPVYNLVNPARASVQIPGAPTAAPFFGTADVLQGNSMRVSWAPGNGQRRLVIARAGSPVTSAPVDGVDYAANADFNLAQEIIPGERVLYDSTTNSEFFTGLQPGTTYFFRIYEFNIANGTTFYYTGAFGAGQGTTLSPPPFGPISITFGNVTNNSVDVSWQSGGGTSRLLIARQRNPVDEVPQDFISYNANTDFGSGDQLGTGNFVVFRGNATGATITNLQAGSTYYFALYELNGSSAPVYFRPGLPGSVTLAGPPQTPASSVTADSITGNKLTIRWTNGSGNGRLVLMSEGAAVNAVPVNNVEYAADSIYGSGSELRTTAGNFAVYNGTGNSVTVTNLRARTTYHFTVFEFNRFSAADIQYLTSSVASGQAITDAPLPVTITDFSAAETGNAIKLSWTTAQEQNSSHFEIQKSADGSVFVAAGSVQAAGNSDNPRHYQFTDNDPIDGTSYYRLKEVDRDGTFKYSRTLTLRYEAKSVIRKIINPFSNAIFIRFTAGIVPAGTAWRLYDMQGRLVLARQTTVNTINEPATGLKPGVYLLEIMIRGKKQVIKLIKSE